MPSITFTDALRKEYDDLFNSCVIKSDSIQYVDQLVAAIVANKQRYESVGSVINIPWYFVAVIHNMEAGLSFSKHLHNGDPLTGRTFHVPADRPVKGNPPFTWEDSAIDALTLKKLNTKTDWSLAGTLYLLESYNGFGYRLKHPYVLTPYLWSYSNHYTSGKYVADGTWSDTATSKQCGAAVLLRRLAEKSLIEFPDQPAPAQGTSPLVVNYSLQKSGDPALLNRAIELQKWLNTFPGIFVKPDGAPGDLTSNAYKKVTGFYLPGDPRG
jgi:lysozyme family protein